MQHQGQKDKSHTNFQIATYFSLLEELNVLTMGIVLLKHLSLVCNFKQCHHIR